MPCPFVRSLLQKLHSHFLHFTLLAWSLTFFIYLSVCSFIRSFYFSSIHQIYSAISKCQTRFCWNGLHSYISLPCQHFQWENHKYNRLRDLHSFRLRYAFVCNIPFLVVRLLKIHLISIRAFNFLNTLEWTELLF